MKRWIFLVHGVNHHLFFLIDWLTGQTGAQLKEQSVGADFTSLTLLDLKPDTEYVINLYPLIPRNSASPATLTARTCESSYVTVQKLGVSFLFIKEINTLN